MESSDVAQLRELAPRVLAALLRRHRQLTLCEDAVQEALLVAVRDWPTRGRPLDPAAWLYRVASRRVVDEVRGEGARREREAVVISLITPELQASLPPDESLEDGLDDTLELLFMCCHPALSPSSAIALTLRAAGGLTTAEIARAFLVPEPTMGQRLSRAKQTLTTAGVSFARTEPAERRERLGLVLQVLSLIFNEGYAASSGETVLRVDLSTEALRLARVLNRAMPDEPEVEGLLALFLLTDARREARTGPLGELVPLDRQDRTRWNAEAIQEGSALITRAFTRGAVGLFQLQAAIASLHDEASSTETTDWPQIASLYEVLRRIQDSPMAALSHVIALAMVEGPRSGLQRLDALALEDPRLASHHRWHAARAHLLERASDFTNAAEAYARAAGLTTSLAERTYLEVQAATLTERATTSAPSPRQG